VGLEERLGGGRGEMEEKKGKRIRRGVLPQHEQ